LGCATLLFGLASTWCGLAIGCAARPSAAAQPVPPRDETRGLRADDAALVQGVLESFHAAASRADEQAYIGSFARDGVFLGTDASERWDVPSFRAYVHPFFATGRGFTYVPRDRHVGFSASGDVAWFDELLDHERYGELRGTGVLVREAGRWAIVQYNLTFTVPNEVAGQVVPLLVRPEEPAPASAVP
jgi:hypothetical protein